MTRLQKNNNRQVHSIRSTIVRFCTSLIIMSVLTVYSSLSAHDIRNGAEIQAGETRLLSDKNVKGDDLYRRMTVRRYSDGFALSGWNEEVGMRLWWDDSIADNFLFIRPDSNLEWALILYELPDSDTITAYIESYSLSFFKQNELSLSERIIGNERPDSVIHSYAIYHETKRGDWSHTAGDDYDGTMIDRYGTGKLCHIYRPYAYDSKGDTVWCQLNISDNQFQIVLPHLWMENAALPIVIDPIFGNTVVGGTTDNANGWSTYQMHTFNGTNNSTIDSFHIYHKGTSSVASDYDASLYSKSGSKPASQLEKIDRNYNAGITPSWQTFTASGGQILSNGTTYYLAFAGSIEVEYYDVSSPPDSMWYDNESFLPVTASVPDGWNETWLYSMYAAYSEPGGSSPSSNRRRRTILERGLQ